jgi:hypothetical protein
VTRKRAGQWQGLGIAPRTALPLGWDTVEVDYIRGFPLGITVMRFDSMLSH